MYTLAIYYQGPFEAQSLIGRLLSRHPMQVYEVNPQLFNPRGTLMVNLGVQKIYFKPNSIPSDKEELEMVIKRILEHILRRNDGIKIGRFLQPPGFGLIGSPIDRSY